MGKATYKYKSASGEPTLTERIRIKIDSIGNDREFSLDDFRDIPTNVPSALRKLEAQGEIILLGRKKIEGERYSRNFYSKIPSNRLASRITFPPFPIIQIIKVGERL